MLQVKNLTTGEVISISNVSAVNGVIMGRYEFGNRFYNKYGKIVNRIGADGDRPIFEIQPGWELVSRPRKAHAAGMVKQVQVVEPEPEPEPEPKPKMAGNSRGYSKAEKTSAADIFGGIFEVVEQRVTESVMTAIQPTLRNAVLKVQIIDVQGRIKTMQGIFHKEFEKACQLVSDGVPVYFYGPSGSGKNIMAEQISQALGYQYYYQSCVKDEYELKGFPNANGEYVPSEFYKAWTGGGLFVLDEADGIPQDVSLVLNQAFANREFTFPVVGTCKAHKDFRVIACGNTAMSGASIEYNGRYCQDGAFKNRFAFINVGYDERIEQSLAQGDEQILSFIKALRKSAEDRHITLVCGYRQILRMAQYRSIFEPDACIDMFVTQGMRIDELRILNEGLDIPDNCYVSAFRKMAKAV